MGITVPLRSVGLEIIILKKKNLRIIFRLNFIPLNKM